MEDRIGAAREGRKDANEQEVITTLRREKIDVVGEAGQGRFHSDLNVLISTMDIYYYGL